MSVGAEMLPLRSSRPATAIAGMSRLLNRLLDIAKLEYGAIKPEIDVWNIQPLFSELAFELTESARSKGLSLTVEVAAAQVHDSGIGMATEELTRIYDEFYQIGIPANTSRDLPVADAAAFDT
jgi:signal transduction histidine kinase